MWIGDRTWNHCPQCSAWGYCTILTAEHLTMDLRCAKGHCWTHETSAPERLHLRPPAPPPKPRVYSVHRGRAENGPWTRGVKVRDFEQGRSVVDRWRRDRPDLWCMVAIDGSPFMKAAPLREVMRGRT